MADVYKLPGSSYDELVKIIRAYSMNKCGAVVSLADLSQASGIDRTIISRNNGFLIQVGLITEGNKKASTEMCVELGKAYQFNMSDQIEKIWSDVVDHDDFLGHMVSAIQIKGKMTKNDFINHILFSSSNNNSNNARAGAVAVIEILKLTRLIDEKDSVIVEGSKVSGIQNKEATKKQNDIEVKMPVNKKEEALTKENGIAGAQYYMQSYTCESGKAAKFIIPEDATEDDLLAFNDMLTIVLKRKFKIKLI